MHAQRTATVGQCHRSVYGSIHHDRCKNERWPMELGVGTPAMMIEHQVGVDVESLLDWPGSVETLETALRPNQGVPGFLQSGMAGEEPLYVGGPGRR